LSRGRNRGVAACRSPIIGFLDDDCIPAKNWIRSALDAMRAFPDSAVWIGQDYENADDDPDPLPPGYAKTELTLSGKNDPWRLGPTGGNAFFRKSVFADVGLFDPLLGQGSDFPGAEDGDMIYRVLRHNLRVTYTNTIRCVHVGWRGREGNIQNGYNYGVGVGAMLAKHAAAGDFFPLCRIFPLRFLPMFLSLPGNLLPGRGEKFRLRLKWSQGIVVGFLQWRRR
jgi:glycosyltransferase involved in cell wall biosynthesis